MYDLLPMYTTGSPARRMRLQAQSPSLNLRFASTAVSKAPGGITPGGKSVFFNVIIILTVTRDFVDAFCEFEKSPQKCFLATCFEQSLLHYLRLWHRGQDAASRNVYHLIFLPLLQLEVRSTEGIMAREWGQEWDVFRLARVAIECQETTRRMASLRGIMSH